MPEVQCSRTTDADLVRSWDFVKEIDNWATLLPGYKSHEKIDDRHSRWTVRGDVGVLARTVELEVSIDEWVEQSRVAFSINGLTEIVTGNGVFRMLGPGAALGAATAAAAEEEVATSPPAKVSWLSRLLARFRRRRKAAQASAASSAGPTVIESGKSGFDFELSLVAGGMIGPVVNVMLEGLIVKMGEEFAANVANAIETGKV